jgi:hypothetical protein
MRSRSFGPMIMAITLSLGCPRGENLHGRSTTPDRIVLGDRLDAESTSTSENIDTAELAEAMRSSHFLRMPHRVTLVGLDDLHKLITQVPTSTQHPEWSDIYSERREIRRVVPCDSCLNDVLVTIGAALVTVACNRDAIADIARDVIEGRLKTDKFVVVGSGWDDGALKAVRTSKGVMFRGLYERVTLSFVEPRSRNTMLHLLMFYEVRTSPRQNDRPSVWDDSTDEQASSEYIGALTASLRRDIMDGYQQTCQRRIRPDQSQRD